MAAAHVDMEQAKAACQVLLPSPVCFVSAVGWPCCSFS